MPSVEQLQTKFTSGELDPLLAAREDLTYYSNGAELLENVVVIPQGGVQRRGGMKYIGRRRATLEAVSFSGATVTMPAGGTASVLTDGSTSTRTETTYVVEGADLLFHIDFGSAVAVSGFDLINALFTAAPQGDGGANADSANLTLQYSDDDSNWTTLGAVRLSKGLARNGTFMLDPGATPESHRYWRCGWNPEGNIVSPESDPNSAVAIAEIRFWVETSTMADARTFPFSYSQGQEFLFVATEGHADIYDDNDDYAASVILPYDADELFEINYIQQLDTIFLLHPDHPPQRILRAEGDTVWIWGDLEFDLLPTFDDGIISTAGISLTLGATSGDGVSVTAGDGIFFSSMTDGWAIRELDGPGYGYISAYTNNTSINIDIVIEFSETGKTGGAGGGGNFAPSDWALERPVISSTQGYPRTGALYQGRLYFAGMKSLPNAIMGSRINSYFDFGLGEGLDDEPVFAIIDSGQVHIIQHLFSGRHLQVFTDLGEFYLPSEPITPSNFAIKQTSRLGSAPGLEPVDIAGATVFVQAEKAALREYIFSEAEQAYLATAISLLASHLMHNPVAIGLRRGTETSEADMYLMALGAKSGAAEDLEGKVAILTTLRDQEVTAFVRMTTRSGDSIVDVTALKNGAIYFLTERSIDGSTAYSIERWDDSRFLDMSGLSESDSDDFTATAGQTVFTYTFTSPATTAEVGVSINNAVVDSDDYTVDLGMKTVTLDTGASVGDAVNVHVIQSDLSGLDDWEGEELTFRIDGSAGGTATVASGEVTLPQSSRVSVEYGFPFSKKVTPMPIRPNVQFGTLASRKARIFEATLQLYRTGGVDLKANGGTSRTVALREIGSDLLDKGIDELLFTGTKTVPGLRGWQNDPQIEITLDDPVEFNLLGLSYRAQFGD